MAKSEYQPLIKALQEVFGSQFVCAVLFGSRARRDERPQSDHDIFVVVSGLPREPLERRRELSRALLICIADLPERIRLVGKTPEEVKMNLTPLLFDICHDGKCLFGEEYFEPLREKALAAGRAAGLRLLNEGAGRYWVLPGAPSTTWELTWEGFRERS